MAPLSFLSFVTSWPQFLLLPMLSCESLSMVFSLFPRNKHFFPSFSFGASFCLHNQHSCKNISFPATNPSHTNERILSLLRVHLFLLGVEPAQISLPCFGPRPTTLLDFSSGFPTKTSNSLLLSQGKSIHLCRASHKVV